MKVHRAFRRKMAPTTSPDSKLGLWERWLERTRKGNVELVDACLISEEEGYRRVRINELSERAIPHELMISDVHSGPLLGQLIISKFQMATMMRANIPQKQRRNFWLYIDEFQTFTDVATASYEKILSRARKYRLGLILAHQQTGQIPTTLLKAGVMSRRSRVSWSRLMMRRSSRVSLSPTLTARLPISPRRYSESQGRPAVLQNRSIYFPDEDPSC